MKIMSEGFKLGERELTQ